MNKLAKVEPIKTSLLEQVVIGGDLAKLTPNERVNYYRDMCASLGLNPLTKPFAYLTLNGKLVLYAQRDCTDQLRKINGISVELTETKTVGDAFIVVAKASDKSGRHDSSTGAVWVSGLKGEAMCNAMMKAETKAKRRVTLSICGLGLMDDSEVDSVPSARRVQVNDATSSIPHNEETGEVIEPAATDMTFGLPIGWPGDTAEAADWLAAGEQAKNEIQSIQRLEDVERWETLNADGLSRCMKLYNKLYQRVGELLTDRKEALSA